MADNMIPGDSNLDAIDELEIEALSDDVLEAVAGATSTGQTCCSCTNCSNAPKFTE